MTSRSVLLIDAGHLLTAGAALCLGNLSRAEVAANHLELIDKLKRKVSKLSEHSLLRTYWFDGKAPGIQSNELDVIEAMPGLRMILRPMEGGRQKGVDLALSRKLLQLSRVPKVDSIFLVAGDGDLEDAILDAEDQGVSVILISVDASEFSRPSRRLQIAADDYHVLDRDLLKSSFQPLGVLHRMSPLDIPGRSSVTPNHPSDQTDISQRLRERLIGAFKNYPIIKGQFSDPTDFGAYAADFLCSQPDLKDVMRTVNRLLPQIPRALDAALLMLAAQVYEQNELTEAQRRGLRAGFVGTVRMRLEQG